ncbi:Lipoprotein signal peptidase [bioreactor metagenome]|uniref:Lipoprotein signal peptidase n=1 Tax=bioreactor metagenome TaxID=1076179 RepID=A0A645FVG5_9ZZZZ
MYVLSLIMIASLVVIDQILKEIVVRYLMPIGSHAFISGFMEWHYVENTGAAFGSLSEHTMALSIVTLLILAGGIAVLLSGRVKNKLLYYAFVLIISGGMGNLIDRVFRGTKLFNGYVVDYIRVLFVDFAVFNFADCMVSIGAGMIIIYLIFDIIRDVRERA